jgi:hypothetical protein
VGKAPAEIIRQHREILLPSQALTDVGSVEIPENENVPFVLLLICVAAKPPDAFLNDLCNFRAAVDVIFAAAPGGVMMLTDACNDPDGGGNHKLHKHT